MAKPHCASRSFFTVIFAVLARSGPRPELRPTGASPLRKLARLRGKRPLEEEVDQQGPAETGSAERKNQASAGRPLVVVQTADPAGPRSDRAARKAHRGLFPLFELSFDGALTILNRSLNIAP